MNNWKDDKKWSDRFLPEIKQILGLYLIGEAPEEEDQKHNTDLTVLKMEVIRIACRIRRPEFYSKYPCEFTIRSSRPSGCLTDLAKIIEGWARYLFYGFSDMEEQFLIKWSLIDLNIFRLWFNTQLCKNEGKLPGIEKPNKDGSSYFRAFNISKMPKEMIFQSSN